MKWVGGWVGVGWSLLLLHTCSHPTFVAAAGEVGLSIFFEEVSIEPPQTCRGGAVLGKGLN